MNAQDKSFQEHLVQLKEKIRRQSESRLKEQERMLEHKQKVSPGADWAMDRGHSITWVLVKVRTKHLTEVINPEGNPKAYESVKCQINWVILKP